MSFENVGVAPAVCAAVGDARGGGAFDEFQEDRRPFDLRRQLLHAALLHAHVADEGAEEVAPAGAHRVGHGNLDGKLVAVAVQAALVDNGTLTVKGAWSTPPETQGGRFRGGAVGSSAKVSE